MLTNPMGYACEFCDEDVRKKASDFPAPFISKCCNAEVRPYKDDATMGDTNFYICTKCKQTCDFIPKSEAKMGRTYKPRCT